MKIVRKNSGQIFFFFKKIAGYTSYEKSEKIWKQMLPL